MALIGSIAINMKLMTQSFTKGIGSARKSLNNLVGQTAGMNRVLAGASLVGAGVGLYKVAKAASSLAEQTDRARVMFGDSAAEIIKESDLMAGAFGTAKAEFIGSASAIGGQLKGMGYASDAAAKLGVHFTKLAMDVASTTQISNEEAFTRMASGLAGESEAVRRWGVDLTEANLKIQAVNRGIAKMGAELTQAQKEQVRTILLDEKLSYAKGNLAKTAGGAENATKGLMGRLENLAETIGTALLPIVGSAMVELQVGVEALSMTWTDMTKGIVNDQVGVVGAVGETAASMGWLQKSVGFVADAFQVLKIGFYAAQSFITAGIGRIVSGLAGLVGALDSVLVAIGGVKTGIGDFLQTYGNDLKSLSEKQYETFQAQLAAPAASEGVNAAFSAAQERIKGMRKEAAKSGVNPADFKPVEGPAKVSGVPKFASAAMVGSGEATNAMLRSRYGSGAGGRKPEEETARNTRRSNQILEKIAGAVMSGGIGQANMQAIGGGALLAGNF